MIEDLKTIYEAIHEIKHHKTRFKKKTNEKIDYLSEKFNQLIIPENS